jgi:hypothetical protein
MLHIVFTVFFSSLQAFLHIMGMMLSQRSEHCVRHEYDYLAEVSIAENER